MKLLRRGRLLRQALVILVSLPLLVARPVQAGMADRVTFVIDEKGKIAHVIDRPDVANHAEEVLAVL